MTSKLTRALPAGFADAAFSSLATFIVGVLAVRTLDETSLGVYALFFTVFMVVSIVPAQLVLTPSRVAAVRLPLPERLSLVPRSLLLAIAPGLGTAVLIAAVAAILAPAEGSSDVVTALALTSGATAVVSAGQDHVRQMLHIAGHSWRAAAVSAVQAATVAVTIGMLTLLDVAAAWIPFGALLAANVVSISAGLGLAANTQPSPSEYSMPRS